MEAWLDQLLAYFDEPGWDELLLNGCRSLSLQGSGAGALRLEPSPFSDSQQLQWQIQEFVWGQGLRLDPLQPRAGGFLCEQRLRWQALIPPLVAGGPVLALRRHRFEQLGLEAFAASSQLLTELVAHFQAGSALLFCGPTGSGKTSLLAVLLRQFALSERVLILEELSELPLLGEHWLRLLARRAERGGEGGFDLSDLVQESLRLRPDRLVLGELRSAEVGAYFEAICSGHRGSCATFHAATPQQLRLRLLRPLAREGFPLAALGSEPIWGVYLERGSPPCIREVAPLDLSQALTF